MNSIADGSVIVQTSCQSVPSTPSWFEEVALMAQHLRKQGILSAVCEHVRFARRRFGHCEVIDLVAVLFGYAISDERTLEALYLYTGESLDAHPTFIPHLPLMEYIDGMLLQGTHIRCNA